MVELAGGRGSGALAAATADAASARPQSCCRCTPSQVESADGYETRRQGAAACMPLPSAPCHALRTANRLCCHAGASALTARSLQV